MIRIDTHQHFWRYDPKNYSWISNDMPELQHDHLPQDLSPFLNKYHFDGCIAVQARQNRQENFFLLDLASNNPWIIAIIGWIDLRSNDLANELEKWSQHNIIKGYRHLIQDETNPAQFLQDPLFNKGVKRLQQAGLIYEILIHSNNLIDATQFSAKHDQHVLVLDHLGKPAINNEDMVDWKNRLKQLSKQQHVYCKLSGLITEAGKNWQTKQIAPYIDIALECFGPYRLMFGSDWPVCKLAGEYDQVYHLIEEQINQLSTDEQNAIWGNNALTVYQLESK